MYDDDRKPLDTDSLFLRDELKPELRSHDLREENTVEVTLAELRRALAVLAVLEMDEERDAAGEALWVH